MAGGGRSSRASRKAKVYTAVVGAVGATLIGIWQGFGTGLVDRIFPATEAKAPPVSAGPPAASTAGGGIGTGSGTATTAATAPIAVETVRKRVPLSVSAVGMGASEARACDAAIRDLVRQAESQCDRTLMEQGGGSRRLEGATNECRTCGVAGGDWRCVAQSAPECVIMGGNNDRSNQ